jgi:SPP1 family predicted phage head-tail adaptor
MVTNLLNKTASIFRKVRTSDGQGGFVESYESQGSCLVRVSPNTGSESEVASLENRQVGYKVYALTTVDIERGDKLIIGDLSLEVLSVVEPSLMAHHYEIECIEWQREV